MDKGIKFKRGEIKINCNLHEEELIVKVAQIKGEKPIFLCLECLMDKSDFVKNNKNIICSVEKYFSDIVETIGSLKENRQEKIDSMPKIAKEFYDNYYSTQDDFKDKIKLEKGKVSEIFKTTVKNIRAFFVKAEDDLKENLDKQEKKFVKNSEYLRDKIDENYSMKGLPGESEILSNLNRKSNKEINSNNPLKKYVESLNNLAKDKDQKVYKSFYDLAYNQINHNINNPPKVKCPEQVREKLLQLERAIKESLELIVEDIKISSKNTKVVDISKLSLEDARRNISQDGLCGFMKFESENHKVSFKLKKKIMANDVSPVTCIMNFGNDHIATGSRNGDLRVYNLNTSHLVAELEIHQDFVTSLCTLTPIWELQKGILCSGSANLDGRIIIWPVFDKTRGHYSLKGKGHSGNVTCLANLGNSRSLVSAGHDGNIIIWDCIKFRETSRYPAHRNMITCLRFVQCRKQVLSTGWDAKIKIWSLTLKSDSHGLFYSEMKLERTMSNECPIVNILVRQIKGNFIVVIGANNRLKVLNIETDEIEGEFMRSDNRAEVCLIENKYKLGKADFITLNTSVKEDAKVTYRETGSFRQPSSTSSFFTQPKVQIVQNTKDGLRLVKVIDQGENRVNLNVYDIV